MGGSSITSSTAASSSKYSSLNHWNHCLPQLQDCLQIPDHQHLVSEYLLKRSNQLLPLSVKIQKTLWQGVFHSLTISFISCDIRSAVCSDSILRTAIVILQILSAELKILLQLEYS